MGMLVAAGDRSLLLLMLPLMMMTAPQLHALWAPSPPLPQTTQE